MKKLLQHKELLEVFRHHKQLFAEGKIRALEFKDIVQRRATSFSVSQREACLDKSERESLQAVEQSRVQ